MIIKIFHTALCVLCCGLAYSQSISKYELSDTLSEISGLEFLNDTTLIAINDGGNKAEVYLLDLKGKILKTVKITNAENVDWEDLAVDSEYLYIGDIGNNENKRESVVIYRVKLKDLRTKIKVESDKIEVKYKEQKEYPPKKEELFYDAEAITVYKDTIYLFTKNRSKPSSGKTWVYKIPAKKGEYKLNKSYEIYIGKGGFWNDAITAVDVCGNDFYLMTYNRLMIYTLKDGKFEKKDTWNFKRLTQKESIVVKSSKQFYVADEHHPVLGGGKVVFCKTEQMMELKNFEAVIFDMDGVLIDSEPLWKIAMEAVFNEVGCPLTRKDFQRTVGLRIDEVIEFWYNEVGWEKYSPKEVEDKIIQHMIALIGANGDPLPGVMETLEYLKSTGIKIGLATSSYVVLIEAVLDAIEAKSYFDFVHSAEHEAFGKPHPAVYLKVANHLSVAPTKCLVIEDSLNGIISAKAARMKAVCIPEKTHSPEPKLILADYHFDDMKQFLKQIKNT